MNRFWNTLGIVVHTGRRHFPWLDNVRSSSVYTRNVRRYIPHGYCDDYTRCSKSYSTALTYTELVFSVYYFAKSAI